MYYNWKVEGFKRESFFYQNILKKEYENIIWTKNYKNFFDFNLKIDFIAIKKNEWSEANEIVFIQIGSAKKDFYFNYKQVKFDLNKNKKYQKFIFNFLIKENFIQFNQKYIFYYRFYALFKNYNTEEEFLIKDYKVLLKKTYFRK